MRATGHKARTRAKDRAPTAASSPPAGERPRFQLGDRLALRPAEAAAALGLSERKLRELLPELPHIRRGGVVLLPVDGLRRWLLERAKREQDRVDSAVSEVLRSLE